jgi:hypothetical protein
MRCGQKNRTLESAFVALGALRRRQLQQGLRDNIRMPAVLVLLEGAEEDVVCIL